MKYVLYIFYYYNFHFILFFIFWGEKGSHVTKVFICQVGCPLGDGGSWNFCDIEVNILFMTT